MLRNRMIVIIFGILFFSMSLAEANDSKWEKWLPVDGATAKLGNKTLGVFYDPAKPTQIFLYPSCWVIIRDQKIVLLPNCHVKKNGNTLLVDKSLKNKNGDIEGVLWDDPKMEISFWSWIFRRPKFKSTSVSIYDGEEWLHIKGLPKVK